ncbi:hypothetical protein D0469_19330 [Peribacillus saganii]|uniref:Uncharacterized protein n=1 Tax=Peribacillus saganii TaxID=2303992 RepID=A0A372LEF5_9BACI|nr:hypothetical protein [Peribacillus saganii]RFU63680.1 hypothetical protein D0469_19330 [Peribacillus saganii]
MEAIDFNLHDNHYISKIHTIDSKYRYQLTLKIDKDIYEDTIQLILSSSNKIGTFEIFQDAEFNYNLSVNLKLPLSSDYDYSISRKSKFKFNFVCTPAHIMTMEEYGKAINRSKTRDEQRLSKAPIRVYKGGTVRPR